jgi:glycosyltransferase involved in cell wall biosynthesis
MSAGFARPQPFGGVAYVGSFRFPDGDAGAARVLGIGKALREAGFSVLFAGVEKRGRPQDRQPDGRFFCEGFPYLPEKDLGDTGVSRLKRAWLTHLSGSTTMGRLRGMNLAGTRAIIAYNASSLLLWRLCGFCRRRQIALIADCSEWYDLRHTIGGVLGPLAWDSELRMRCLQPRIGRVIAISSFLERYYRARGCVVLRVPPLIDMDDGRPNQADQVSHKDKDNVLRLVYAGVPGKKDLLGSAVRALRDLRASGLPVVLDLVGPSRQTAATWLGGGRLLDELGSGVVCHGRVPHKVALGLVARADFSLLLRPDKRYAHAGFPTKLVESLSLGVPVISNPTSDIAEYVRDGKEGVLLADSTPEAFAAGVKRILDMPREQWSTMRLGARQRASDCFDYRRHAQRLKEFMREVLASDAMGRQEGKSQ